jgi:hypothetical protein
MDEGVTAKFKIYYLLEVFNSSLKQLLERINLQSWIKKYNIMAAVDSVAKSWDEMSKSTVMNDVWKNIGWSLYVT